MAGAAYRVARIFLNAEVRETVAKAVVAAQTNNSISISVSRQEIGSIKDRSLSYQATNQHGVWIIVREREPYKSLRRSEEFTKEIVYNFDEHYIFGERPRPTLYPDGDVRGPFSEKELAKVLSKSSYYVILDVEQTVRNKKAGKLLPGHIAVSVVKSLSEHCLMEDDLLMSKTGEVSRSKEAVSFSHGRHITDARSAKYETVEEYRYGFWQKFFKEHPNGGDGFPKDVLERSQRFLICIPLRYIQFESEHETEAFKLAKIKEYMTIEKSKSRYVLGRESCSQAALEVLGIKAPAKEMSPQTAAKKIATEYLKGYAFFDKLQYVIDHLTKSGDEIAEEIHDQDVSPEYK